jgi:hypothetical protein
MHAWLFPFIVVIRLIEASQEYEVVTVSELNKLISRKQTFELVAGHVSDRWRLKAGFPQPADGHVALWTKLHDVGIGNAINGIGKGIQFALATNRTVMFQSSIVEKFCLLLRCAWQSVEGQRFKDISHVDLFHINEESAHLDKVLESIGKWPVTFDPLTNVYPHAGCQVHLMSPWEDTRRFAHKLCFQTKVLRSFVLGSGGMLQGQQFAWLEK